MHKKEGGTVVVRIGQLAIDTLQVTIADDGIGRQRAAELKSKSATRHKSFGMKVTSERIQLINQLYQSHTQVQVHDLVDRQGKLRVQKSSLLFLFNPWINSTSDAESDSSR
jgi:hypothetical protein